MSSREEHLSELYVIMSQKSNIKCFFKKAQDIDPDPVVDLTRDVTVKENTPKKRKADVLSDDAASPSPKKKTVSLATFQSWKYDCIGFRSEVVGGGERVVEIWCKVCAKYTPSSEKHGMAAKAANSMITGNSTVQKHTVNIYTF